MIKPASSARRSIETGLHGVADRLIKVRIRKADVAADAVSTPPRMRALDAKAVEMGDERRRAFETVSGHARDPGLAQPVLLAAEAWAEDY